MPAGELDASTPSKELRSLIASSKTQTNCSSVMINLPSDEITAGKRSVGQRTDSGADTIGVGGASPRFSRSGSMDVSSRRPSTRIADAPLLTSPAFKTERRFYSKVSRIVNQNSTSTSVENRRGSRTHSTVAGAITDMLNSRRKTAGDITKPQRRGSNVDVLNHGKRLSLKPEYEDSRGGRWRRASAFTGFLGSANLSRSNSARGSDHELKEPVIPKYRFKTMGRLIIVLSRMLKFHMQTCEKKGCFSEQYNQIDGTASLGIEKNSDLFFDPSEFKANKQMRMTAEAKRILTKRPEDRTEAEINYAMIGLRGNRMIADYPVRFQRKLAQNGTFESYESMRVIVRQGHPPQAFYFIMYGTVIVAVLGPGDESAVTVCHLSRGDSFGELAIRNNETRASTVITKNYIEMLSISSHTYQKVFMVGGSKNINDPDHNEFMSSIEFLRGWPTRLLDDNTKKFVFTYFKRGAVMVKDSNYSDWIYIVKSGSAQVLKKLVRTVPKIDSVSGKCINKPKPTAKDGFEAFMRDEYEAFCTLHGGKDAVEKAFDSITCVKNAQANPGKLKKIRPSSDGSRQRSSNEPQERRSASANKGDRQTGNVTFAQEKEATTSGEDIIKVVQKIKTAKRYAKQGVEMFRKRKKQHAVAERYKKKVIASDDQEDANKNPDFKEQRRTFLDDLDSAYKDRAHIITEADINPQFVKVQTLTKGSVFGLAQVVFIGDKQPSFCVVSNGSECLMLNKQFFREHCPVELSRKLLKTVSPYPTDREMQDDLLTRLNWDALRQSTLNQVVSDIQGLKVRHSYVNPCLSMN